MADRKKERKGARKTAASKPKVAASKKTAAVKTATPRNSPAVQKRNAVTSKGGPTPPPIIPPGLSELTEPVAFGDMADGSGTRIVTAQEQPPHPVETTVSVGVETAASVGVETTVIRAAPAQQVGLQDVARLLEQISTTLAALRSRQAPDGDNQASERNEAIDDFEVYIRLGNITIRVVQEQTLSQAPSKAVVEQNAAAFETVEIGAKSFRRRLSELAGFGLGAVGRGALQEVGKVAADQIGALLLELPNLIGALHHWATLIT